MKAKRPPPGPFRDFLLTVLHYEPESGELRWRIDWHDEASGEQLHFCGNLAGKIERRGKYRFLVTRLEGKDWHCSRLIWLMQTGEWPKHIIDHKNGDALDNRWKNLRDVTPLQNSRNRPGSKIREDFLREVPLREYEVEP